MPITDLSLREQASIDDFELSRRKRLIGLAAADEAALLACQVALAPHQADALTRAFYAALVQVSDAARLIGDSDTLERLHRSLHRYVMDLVSGHYGLDYVNHRLRMGLVHKRLGLEPTFYLAALRQLMALVRGAIASSPLLDTATIEAALPALDKLETLDTSLFVEAYLRGVAEDHAAHHERLAGRIGELERRLGERSQQLVDLARTDPLTGLVNRRHLEDTLGQALAAAQRRREPLCVALFDIDHFQRYNDQHGPVAGDRVLRLVGDTVAAISRTEDSSFRYGGDEFCVVLQNCSELDAMNLYCRRLYAQLAEILPGTRLTAGVASTGPVDYLSTEALLALADTRMHQAKYLGPDSDSGFMPDDGAVDLRRIVQRTPRGG